VTVDFDDITPEDIIGPNIPARNWKIRTDQEKKCSWHFHINAHGVHGCVTGVRGDTVAEAADNALDEFMPRFQLATSSEDLSMPQIFGNRRLTYCATPGCTGCEFPVRVVRLQDVRLIEPGPVRPSVSCSISSNQSTSPPGVGPVSKIKQNRRRTRI
jgi:hypothetical protein